MTLKLTFLRQTFEFRCAISAQLKMIELANNRIFVDLIPSIAPYSGALMTFNSSVSSSFFGRKSNVKDLLVINYKLISLQSCVMPWRKHTHTHTHLNPMKFDRTLFSYRSLLIWCQFNLIMGEQRLARQDSK